MVDNSVVVRLLVRDDGTVELKRFQGQLAATKAEAESLGRSGASLGTLFDSLDGKIGNLGGQLGGLRGRLVATSTTLRNDLAVAIRDVTLGLTAAAGAADYFGLRAVDSFQKSQAAFSVLTGSVAAGRQTYQQLIGLNLKSPLGMQPLAAGAQTLLGFGLNRGQSLGVLQQLANVAAIQQDPNAALDRMALAVGQINRSGTVRAQDLNQLVQSGFPAYSMIPGGHAGLLAGGHSMSSQHFMNELLDPNNPALQLYAGAAQRMNRNSLSGQFSNLFTKVQQSAIHAFHPAAESLIAGMPDLTKELKRDTRVLGPDMANLGLDIVHGAEKLLPVLVPIVHSLMTGMDSLLKSGGPFLTELQHLDPQITNAIDEMFTTLGDEAPQLAGIFGDLVGVLPLFIDDLDTLLKLSHPMFHLLDTLLGFKPLQHIFSGLLIALVAYKTLDGPIGAILGFSKAIRGLAASEAELAVAETAANRAGMGLTVGKGGAAGRGGWMSKIFPRGGGMALLGGSMLFGPGSDAIHGHFGGSDYLSTLGGGALVGGEYGGAPGAGIGALIGGAFDTGTFLQHRYGHHYAADPGFAYLPKAQMLAAVRDPQVQAELRRDHASINMSNGAIVIHAAPGMDEQKLTQQVIDALDHWVFERQRRK
jgi:hypothetical protein